MVITAIATAIAIVSATVIASATAIASAAATDAAVAADALRLLACATDAKDNSRSLGHYVCLRRGVVD